MRRCERWGGPKVVSMELLLLVNFVACGGAVCELLLIFFCALKTRVKRTTGNEVNILIY